MTWVTRLVETFFPFGSVSVGQVVDLVLDAAGHLLDFAAILTRLSFVLVLLISGEIAEGLLDSPFGFVSLSLVGISDVCHSSPPCLSPLATCIGKTQAIVGTG